SLPPLATLVFSLSALSKRLQFVPALDSTSSKASGILPAQSSTILQSNLFSSNRQSCRTRLGRSSHGRPRKHGVTGVRLSQQLYRDLTLAAEPQGIGAVLRQQWTPLSN